MSKGEENQYLTHIAGLRGLAIVFVLLFHLNGQAWAHGYLGVDVFLVITGYLLFRAAAIRKTDAEGIKDVWVFIRKRFVRIMPLMAIMILLTIAVGYLFLTFKVESLLFSLGVKACYGTVNRELAKLFSNYFASNVLYMPMLHLWYLSVIIQVYLLWGVGKWALQRVPKRWLIVFVSAVALGSLGYRYSFSVHEWLHSVGALTWEQSHEASYYATLPRLWEVLGGGMVLILPELPRKAWATLVSAIGMCGIVLPAVAGGELPLQLIVVAGTILVIRYLPGSCLNFLLCHKPLLWLGGISFSVYLVHMPLIVYGRMWAYGQLSVWDQAALALLSVGVGWVFWWCAEKRRMPLWLALLLWGGTLYTCRYCNKHSYLWEPPAEMEIPAYEAWRPCADESMTADWDPRLPPIVIVYGMMRQMPPTPLPPLLAMGDAERPANVALLGDSHAACLYAGLDHVGREVGLSGVYLLSVVIPYHQRRIYVEPLYQFNPEKEAALLQWLKERPELTHVIISQRWGVKFFQDEEQPEKAMQESLRGFLLELKALGKKVVLIGPQPEYHRITDYMLYERIRKWRGHSVSYPTCSREEHMRTHASMYAILRKMQDEGLCTLIDPLDALTPGEEFLSVRDNMMQMMDDDHMYCGNSIWLVRRLLPQLQRALPMTPQK